MSRREVKFPGLLVGAAILLLLVSAVVFGKAHATGDTVDEIKYSFGDSNDSVVFDWRGAETQIYYGPDINYGQVATAHPSAITPQNGTGPFEEATLTGLQTSTTYHYKIGTSGLDHTFQTLPMGNFNWVDVGDTTGSNCDQSATHTGSWMPAEQQLIANQQPNFVTHGGDISYANECGIGSLHQYFIDQQVWSEHAAFQPVWGDHEWEATLSDSSSDSINDSNSNYKGRVFITHAQTTPADTATRITHPGCGAPQGSKTNTCLGEDWGWFQTGHVLFISYPETSYNSYSDWQAKADPLMAQAQADPNIDFIVTTGFRPPITDSSMGSQAEAYAATQALAAKYSPTASNPNGKYVLDIGHHAHSMEAFKPINGLTYIINAAGGSGLTNWASTINPNSVFRSMHFGLLSATYDATAHKLVVNMVCGPSYIYEKDHCTYGSTLYTTTFTRQNVTPSPELQLSYDDGATQVQSGQQLTYTATLTNPSNATAAGTVLTATLPVGSQFISAADGVVPASDGTVSWPTGDLAPGATVSKQVTVQLGNQSPGVNVTSSAAVTATDNSCQNSSSVCAASDTDTVPSPQLVTSLTDDVTTANVGDDLAYTTSVQNTQANSTANGVNLSITLPANLTIIDAAGGTVNGNTITWPATDLAGGQTLTQTVTAQVASGNLGSNFTTTANVQAADCQNTGSNCSVSDTDTISAPPTPVLTTTVDDSATGAKVGDSLTYTASVENTQSGSDAKGVNLSLTLPTNLNITDAGGGTVNGNTVTWPAVDLNGTIGETVTVTATVASGIAGSNFTTTANVQAAACANTGSVCTAADTDTVQSQAPPRQEYISNQSVEATNTGWTGLYNSQSKSQRVTNVAYDGTASLQVTRNTSSAGQAGVWAKPAPVGSTLAGQSYEASAWIKMQLSDSTIAIQIRENDSSGKQIGITTMTLNNPGDNQWHQLDVSYTAQRNGDTLTMGIEEPSCHMFSWFNVDEMSLLGPITS